MKRPEFNLNGKEIPFAVKTPPTLPRILGNLLEDPSYSHVENNSNPFNGLKMFLTFLIINQVELPCKK